MEQACRAPLNKALCSVLRISLRRPVTYLRCCDHRLFRVCFHSIVHVCWWEEAQPKNLNVNLFISSRLPQSVFSPKPCHGFAASEPSSEQGRRKHLCNILFTWSPTTSPPTVIYWLIFAETSPMILLLVYLFFLMSILNPMTILKYFYYS